VIRSAPAPPLAGSKTRLKHDPENWKPVFRKDHAPPKCQSAIDSI